VTLKTMLAAALLAATLTSCGGAPAMKAEETKDDSDMTPLGPVPTEAAQQEVHVQQTRLVSCAARQKYYRDLGVWVSGGVSPTVDRASWEALSTDAQDEIFDIAACLAASGKKGPQEVTISAQGFDAPVVVRTVPNQRDWSATP
jgi:predicted small lipoprotein YifL